MHSSLLSGINMWLNSVHQASMWLSNLHHASIIMAQYCASWLSVAHPQLIDVHQASAWFNAVYHTSICLNGSMLCIRHHYGTIIWLNAVHASIYGPMLCIRHHNIAQTVHYASISLDAVHPQLKLCIMHQYGQERIKGRSVQLRSIRT